MWIYDTQAKTWSEITSMLTGYIPGGRIWDAHAYDSDTGFLWMLGGYNSASSTDYGAISEFFQFDTSTYKFTLVPGFSVVKYPGAPNTTDSLNSCVGPRGHSQMWIDENHNIWMYGGYCHTDYFTFSYNMCNDMFWMDASTTFQNPLTWYWMQGDNNTVPAVYPSGKALYFK